MRLEVDKDLLIKSISIAESIVSSRHVNSILSNCLFNIDKDQIEIISTDNEIGLRTKLDAISNFKYSFTANGKILTAILKELPQGMVEINIDESNIINIKSKSKDIQGYSNIIGTNADKFPDIPEFKSDDIIEIGQQTLKEMIRKVIYSASTDTTKQVFNGIYITSDLSNNLTLVATDSRRLSIITRFIDNELNFKENVILPLKAANELLRLLGNIGSCYFFIKDNQCFFKIGQTEIVSRVIDDKFPNYKQIIPKEYLIQSVIQTNKIYESIRRAIVFTKEPAYKILLHFSKDFLTVEAKTSELGESREEINIESGSEEEISLGINAQFFMDSIKEIDSTSTLLGVTGQMSPLTISPENDNNYLSVIMPIKMKT